MSNYLFRPMPTEFLLFNPPSINEMQGDQFGKTRQSPMNSREGA